MKNSKLEEMLVEIEKTKPFQNDEDILRAVEKILLKERKKRDSKQDFELINECVETSLMLKGYDIDKLHSYIESTYDERLNRIHEKIRLEQMKDSSKVRIHPKRYRAVIITACVILGLLLASTVAYALGFEPLRYIKEIFGLSVGESIVIDNITYTRGGEIVCYDTIEELYKNQDIDILYPSYLPDDIKLTKVSVSASGSYIFEFSSDTLTYQVYNYELLNFDALSEEIQLYETQQNIYYIFYDDITYTVYFDHDNYQYILQYNNFDELKKILDNMKGYN